MTNNPRQPGEPALLDIFERRLRLEGQLITRTGLHIGAGGSGDPIGTDLPVVRDGLGRPMIPGASLKGVLRSAAEALLRHFQVPAEGQRPELWSCDVVGKDPCVGHEKLKKLRNGLPDRPTAENLRSLAETAWRESCTVCRLFGSMAMAGRVRFPDLLLAEGEAPQLEVRNGVGIDRDKGQAAHTVLYDFEAVPPQTTFELSVLVDNYDDFEIGLLLYLFDELHRGSLVLGGKTTRGLGQVRIAWRNLEEISVDPEVDASNPFENLLRRQSYSEEEVPLEARALPIPEFGDSGMWRRLAHPLDLLEEVSWEDVSQKCQALEFPSKDETARCLDVEGSRQTWKNILRALVDCGRLVKRDGHFIPKARIDAERAAALDGAHIPGWMLPLSERFIGAMNERWKGAA